MFRIVPEVKPYAWMLARSVDCRNKQLPPYAGNLAFMLPVNHEKPTHHAVTLKLCQGRTDYDCKGIYTRLFKGLCYRYFNVLRLKFWLNQTNGRGTARGRNQVNL